MSTPLQLRADVRALTDAAALDLAALWRRAETPELVEAALRDVLPGLIDAYGSGISTVAADWYDDHRQQHEVRGRFTAIPVEIAKTGTDSLVAWALATATDMPSFQSLILGGTQRRLANFGRQTVMTSSIEDPQATGWERVSTGNCSQGFCDMLAGRGAVYSEASADFAAHDNCQCVAVPAFEGQSKPVKPYTPSNKNITDADRARVRAYLASH